MSLIEGIGDEVIVVFGLAFILFVVVLAWLSTNIRDIPFFSVIIVELTQRRRRQAASSHGENQDHQSENLPTEEEPTSPENAADPTPNDSANTANSQNSREPVLETMDSAISSASTSQKEDTVSSIDGVQSDKNSAASKCDVSDKNDDSVDKSCEDSSEEKMIPEHSEDDNLTETELRRRRVAFFEQGKTSDCDSSEVSQCTDSRQSCLPLVSDENQIALGNVDSDVGVQSTFHSDSSVPTENLSSSQSPNDQRQESLGTSTAEIRVGEVDLRSGQIRIRLKYLNDDQRNVVAFPNDTIGQFRRQNFATELAENKLVRFIFNGRDLRNDSSTLQANDVVDNSVLHCLITQVNNQAPPPQQEAERGFDMGSLLLPIFGIVLLVMWYMRFEYRQLFTATSTISLIGITALYIAGLLASWESYRRDNGHEHID